MKKYLKEIIPAIMLAFVASFMLFIYEPITVYASNTENFWFSFDELLKNNIAFDLIVICLIIIFSTIIYLISKFSKKEIIYNIYILIANVAFIILYIQGNYLAGKLPTLDGSPIQWNEYTTQEIISYIVIVLVLVVNIFLYKKFKEKYKKIITYITIGIFIMLCASLSSTLLTNNQMYNSKRIYSATNKNINKLSEDKNFLIFLMDTEDSRTFDKVLKENGKEGLLKDFTYFPDTLSAYPYTRESIPFILSGDWYEAETDFLSYSNKAYSESKFIEYLNENKYDVNIYERELFWKDSKVSKIKNTEVVNSKINQIPFLKQEAKYILFKYLPFPLKKYSKINTLDYEGCRKENEATKILFNDDNKKVYDVIGDIELQKNKYFQFVHTDGGHYPWNMNGNFEMIENGSYKEKIESSITLMEKYLNRIKESGQYDNSVIIVLSDHGFNGNDQKGRQNPILYIKGFYEIHDAMQVSDKKVSYIDLNESIYYDLLNGKKSTELLENIEENKIRRYIWYKDYDDMYEQTLDGHAWETEKLKDTGNNYKR